MNHVQSLETGFWPPWWIFSYSWGGTNIFCPCLWNVALLTLTESFEICCPLYANTWAAVMIHLSAMIIPPPLLEDIIRTCQGMVFGGASLPPRILMWTLILCVGWPHTGKIRSLILFHTESKHLSCHINNLCFIFGFGFKTSVGRRQLQICISVFKIKVEGLMHLWFEKNKSPSRQCNRAWLLMPKHVTLGIW